MAKLDFITNAIRRLLPVREVEVPTLGEDLDVTIEVALRDLGALSTLLERMGEDDDGKHGNIYSYASRSLEDISITLNRNWRAERERCGLDNDAIEIGWLHVFS
ncbi:hypothetical protein [Kozakia baliensis]|uniref:hypothetical protein n=1 Tax=Kozakia baliensis TaxID=153496 RepID=UPI00049511B5|nr:hypothetical protein [Kozakia baliensis]